MNSLGYESLNEVFFDVYEIKFRNLELVKEKKGDFNGNPIIEADLTIKDQIFKNVRFVLTNENKIKINPNLLDYTKVVVYEKKNTISPVKIIEEVKSSTPIPVKKKASNKKPLLKEQSLIQKTKSEFFNSIKDEVLEELKREVKAGIISDLIKENLQSNFDSIITDSENTNKLHKIIENFNVSFRKEYTALAEKVAKRESLRYVESGGGGNSVQYSNGGVMNGNLMVNGSLNASHIETNNGGLMNGNLTVNGNISASHIEAPNLLKKMVFDVIGDGTNSYQFTHNFNTRNIIASLYEKTTNELVLCAMETTTPNTITIYLGTGEIIPVGEDKYRLIVIS